jgi:hypothetical protein
VNGDALEWIGRLGQIPPGQALVLAGAAAVFLPAPDLDLWAIRLLHHRSILTHSVLLPLLVLWLLPELGPAAVSGAFLGVAVHMAADLLSPSHGFGRIWWPEPFQVSLGRWSALWLMGNALAASWLAVEMLQVGEGWQVLATVVGGLAAVGYGLRKERSVLSALVALGVVAAGHAPIAWLG